MLLLLHIETMGVKCDHDMFDFVKYFELSTPLDKDDKILDCAWLRWAQNAKRMIHIFSTIHYATELKLENVLDLYLFQ